MTAAFHRAFTSMSVAAAIAAGGCGSGSPGGAPPAGLAPISGAAAVRPGAAQRCTPFAEQFDALVACERADGTLRAFVNANVAWRVRYFVRYREMPCNEAPTENEGYVFHLVTDDLSGDLRLSEKLRTAIRDAMFGGSERCK